MFLEGVENGIYFPIVREATKEEHTKLNQLREDRDYFKILSYYRKHQKQ